jgi:serine protease Do
MKQQFRIIITGFLAGVTGAVAVNYFTPEQQEEQWHKTSNLLSADSYYSSSSYPLERAAGPASLNDDFVNASAISTPCVVYIKTVSGQEATSWYDLFFYGNRGQAVSSGSGVIFSKDGYVITNNHVIENAENIEVIHERRSYTAKIIGRDPSTDIAVLKIDGSNLPVIRFGSSRAVNVGEWVLAVGNPFNLNSTVTAGIVSAKGRNINIMSSQFPLESFIQTDAAINPGNSGGALINTKGELIGINTAIYSRTGSYTGYAFAVPSDIVAKVVNDLIKYGEVQRAFVGAEIKDIDATIAARLNTNDYSGVVLTYIEDGAAADRAGLQEGDVILRVNNRLIMSKAHFDEEISYYNPGDKVSISYRRDSKVRETTLTLTNREGTTDILRREVYTSEKLGADLETVSKVERNKLNIENGVRILRTGNGLLRQLNITEGFVITSINKNPVRAPKDIETYLLNTSGRVIIEGVSKDGVKGYYSFNFH